MNKDAKVGLSIVAVSAVVLSAIFATAIFFGGVERRGLSQLVAGELQEAPVYYIGEDGEYGVQAYVLDADAPSGQEPVFFGDEYAVDIPRLYDDENVGLQIEVSQNEQPYNGVIEIQHPTLQSAPMASLVPQDGALDIGRSAMMLAEETIQLEVTDGLAVWHGEPLVGNSITGETLNQISIAVPEAGEAAVASLHAFSAYDQGAIRDDVIETHTEMATVLSSDQPSDQLVQWAVRDGCGMDPADIAGIEIQPNDQNRYQAGYDPGASYPFIDTSEVIPKGQPIFVVADHDGKKCPINPPCGNPPPPPPPTPTPTPPPPTPTPTPPLEGQLEIVKFKGETPNCQQDAGEPYVGGFTFQVRNKDDGSIARDIDGNLLDAVYVGTEPVHLNMPVGEYIVEEIDGPEHWQPSPCMIDPQTGTALRQASVEPGSLAYVYFENIYVKEPPPDRVCEVAIISLQKVGANSTHAHMQASIQWDIFPNFDYQIEWWEDGAFVDYGSSVEFDVLLHQESDLGVYVLDGPDLICKDEKVVPPQGSDPPGPGDPPGTQTDPPGSSTPAPPIGSDQNDGAP